LNEQLLKPAVPDVPTRLKTGLADGLQTSWKLVRYVIPLYIVVELLKGTTFLATFGALFAPAMRLFGLPGEAAMAFLAGFTLNLYAAIAIPLFFHLGFSFPHEIHIIFSLRDFCQVRRASFR
jgi:hypothetical protein